MKIISTTIVAVIAVIFALSLHGSLKKETQSSVPIHIVMAYNKWVLKENKLYSSPAEHIHRLKNFEQNYYTVEQVNTAKLGYTFALNQFADLSKQEFAAKFLTQNIQKHINDNSNHMSEETLASFEKKIALGYPSSFDWVAKGLTGPVKNQGSCGSCYAVSTTSSIEALYKINGNYPGELSAQKIVDCAGSYGAQGCNGGWPSNVMEFVKYNGINLKITYPYTASEGTCKNLNPKYYIGQTVTMPQRTDNTLLISMINVNPVVVAVDASNFQLYHGGVFSAACSTRPNHAVTAVGYGQTSNGVLFWKIQNSWNTSWGENGFIRMLRKSSRYNDYCTVSSFGVYPSF